MKGSVCVVQPGIDYATISKKVRCRRRESANRRWLPVNGAGKRQILSAFAAPALRAL
jgi:hypothetical protein